MDELDVVRNIEEGIFRPEDERDTYVIASGFTEDAEQTTCTGRKPVTLYSPLSVSELFLDFAELADKEVTLEAMLGWVGRYGVLGLQGIEGGRNDNLQSFGLEARKANYLLRAYEAVTAPDSPSTIDAEKLLYLTAMRPSVRTTTLSADAPREEKVVAMVADIVREVVSRECYPELYRTEHGYVRGWGFESLLGAMYLQMMQLMTSEEVRRCKGPDCRGIIAFEPGEPYMGPSLERNMRGKYKTRKDKEFCSTNCRVKWRYHNVIKPRQKSERARS